MSGPVAAQPAGRTSRFVVTVADGRGTRRDVDVLLDADEQAPLATALPQLVAALGEQVHPSFLAHLPVWVDGRPAEPGESLRANGLRPGAVVSLHAPTVAPDPRGDVRPELRVVAGPGAGRVHRLALGRSLAGCGAPDLSLPDVLLRADAVAVTLAPDGTLSVEVRGVAAALDGEPLPDAGGPQPWPAGALLAVGDTVLQHARDDVPVLEVRPSADGPGGDVSRPPRMLPADREPRFTLPAEPAPVTKRPVPWLGVLLPLLVAVPMAVFVNPTFLLFSLLSPVMMLANVVSDRRSGRAAHRAAVAGWKAADAAVRSEVAAAVAAERDARRVACMDPALGLLTALGPGRRLWERRRRDEDHLRLRVGLASALADVRVDVATTPGLGAAGGTAAAAGTGAAESLRRVPDVPVALDLRRLGVVGVAGDPGVVTGLAHWLAGQVALLHSPRDVRLVVLAAGGGAGWSWVRWLPHTRSDTADGLPALVGTDAQTIGSRVAELTQLVSARQAATPPGAVAGPPPGPDVVVVLDGARRLRGLPGMSALLASGPAVGVRFVCLEDDERALPEECAAVVVCGPRRAEVRTSRAEPVPDVVPDVVEAAWAHRVGRALAPLRDASPDDDEAGLPSSARLLDLLGVDPPTPEAVAAGWRGATTEVVLGAGFDGPFRIDLRRDGPHALVAGTTGAGKSELLQTLVASLALSNRPDELTFVLVDYKGGSAFKDCAQLPHTVGLVTDLDAHLVSRALTSLGAELKRREHLLADAGAKDLEDYDALRRNGSDALRRNVSRAVDGSALAPLPRLVLVIDEFAGLVAELPDFVKGLVGIAQRGRSLGIHLVLATQRPSGVVSPEIRANTALRISLRVTDDAESRDVIDAPDAARIARTTPGRGYARTGHSVLLPFQAGRVGGRRPARRGGAAGPDAADVPPAHAWIVPWERAGLPGPPRPAAAAGPTTDEADTDLSDLVAAVRAAAARLGVPRQHSPWLPALPASVTLDDLPGAGPDAGPSAVGAARPAAVGWALEDRPDDQDQVAATFGPGRDGHLYVVGGPRSGRSTALRTLLTALARAHAVRDVHLYGIDCGNGALLSLGALPHTGAVAVRTAADKVDRLLRRLTDEVARRQEVLAAGGFADLGEQRARSAPDERLPYLVLALDRFEGFLSTFGEVDAGRLVESVQLLLREGASVGVHLVVSGDRSLLSGRMSTLVDRKVVLRLPDRGDYPLAGIPVREVPETMPDGRGLWADGGGELQVALLPGGDASGQGQSDAVARVAADARARAAADGDLPPAQRPFRLESLPALVAADDVRTAVAAARAAVAARGTSGAIAAGALWVPFGVGGDDLAVLGLDLSASPVAMVGGAPRSGRTALLRFVAADAAARGVPLLAVCPRGGPLADDKGVAGRVVSGTSGVAEALTAALRALAPGALVLVDDADLLREGELVPVLTAVVRQAREKEWGVVVAGETGQLGAGLSGWLVDARRGRQGLLLSPQQVLDGDAVGVRLARSALVAKVQPGRGLLVAPGEEPVAVQVPLVG